MSVTRFRFSVVGHTGKTTYIGVDGGHYTADIAHVGRTARRGAGLDVVLPDQPGDVPREQGGHAGIGVQGK
ncbi:hypothetical protein ACFLFF_01040 [Brevibacillus reuszeri]|uniref:hypothetical protein n=1 Tax=Brevibacillus reuszeri TaxID=54915 RepID=UPI00366EEC18